MLRKLKPLVPVITLVITAISANKAAADPIVLTFSGPQNMERPLNYYNGGFGSLGSGPGPAFGISFSQNVTVISVGSKPSLTPNTANRVKP